MLRIVTVSIIGSVMLALAVMAGYELTKEPPVASVEIQQSAEVVNKQDDSVKLAQKKTTSLAVTKPKPAPLALKPAQSDPEGVLVPLDEGTVRADTKVERRSLPSVPGTPSTFDTLGSNEASEAEQETVAQVKAPIKVAPTERKLEQASASETPKTAPQTKPVQIPASAPLRAEASADSLSSPIPVPNIPPIELPAIVPEEKVIPEEKMVSDAEVVSDEPAPVLNKDDTLIPAKELVVYVADTPAKKGANQNTITRMRLEIGPSRVALRCIGDAPLKASYFVLTDPPRFVLDLKGDWAFQLPRIPKNTLLKSFRRGTQDGGTRIVFDLFRVPSISKVLQTNDTTIEARLF